MATKQINFRIDAQLEQEIRERAEAEGISIGQWFQKCARESLGKKETTSDSNSSADSNSSKDSGSDSKSIEYELGHHQELLTSHGNQLDELAHKVELLENAYQRAMGMIEELYTIPIAGNSNGNSSNSTSIAQDSDSSVTITPIVPNSSGKAYKIKGYNSGEAIIPLDEINEEEDREEAVAVWLMDNIASHSIPEEEVVENEYKILAITTTTNSNGNSSGDSSNSTSIVDASKTLSGAKLGKRLGVTESTIRGHAVKGEEHFKQWSKRKDPEGLTWIRDPQTKKYQVQRDDQTDCKANHKPSDDEHRISSGDKYPNGHQENAPSVEQLGKYPSQTPSNGSPKHGVNHKP